MSKIDELIKEMCPNGVEYLPLCNICEVKNGYTPSKKCKEYWENGNIPWFRLEDIRTNGKILLDSIQHINRIGLKGECFPKDSIIFATTATIGEHALIKVPFMCNQQLTHINIKDYKKNKIDINYLFYFSDKIDELCKKT